MLSSGANLKWTQDGKSANFVCDGDAPITFCKEALFQFQVYISKVEEQMKAQQEAQKAAEAPVAEPKPVES